MTTTRFSHILKEKEVLANAKHCHNASNQKIFPWTKAANFFYKDSW